MNLVRRSVLKHPSGLEIKTPMLIPSFSSKGFILREPKERESKYTFFQTITELPDATNLTSGKISEVAELLKNTSETLTDSMLVSAYDIFHKHIPLPYQNTTPEIIFLDSGGYESDDVYDYSEIVRSTGNSNDWETKHYMEVLEKWPDHVPSVFTSYDREFRGKPVVEQMELAKHSLSKFRKKQLCCFLIKPVSKTEKTFKRTLSEICDNITKLKYFNIIGIAEKDLGNSVSMVMKNITQIRLALDNAKIKIPLHIFGSLDPLTSWLYYISGAELFDGLTWLRYGYSDGQAVYYRNHGIISLGIDIKEYKIKVQTIEDNLQYLKDLQLEMAEYAFDGNYDKIRFNRELLKRESEKLDKSLRKRYK